MSIKDHKNPSHRRDNSTELDVFEAARYFSGHNDNYTLVGGTNTTPKMLTKQEKEDYPRVLGRRISLDMHQSHHNFQQQQQQIKEKKYKQPNSPGGKLAHFLNSIFNQTSSSKKKKTSKSSTLSLKDEDHEMSSNMRRKRRSSISHFWSSSSVADAKSLYSSSSSGFRTPPPHNLNTTTTKPFKEFRSFSEHKDFLATLSKLSNNGNANGSSNTKKDEKTRPGSSNMNWVDEKIKSKSGFFERKQKNRDIKKLNEELFDDGAESDSSSDLFELRIDHGYGFCSNGLPVYETTHMNNIRRSSISAITNGPIKN